MLTIDLPTARRFILGKQGLWPGRRWQGLEGAGQAMRAMEYLQLDPLQIIARSHDISLHSRVLDYTPGMWEELAYGKRQFFDWGGWLAVRPMDELPHWRAVMRRERDGAADVDARIRQMSIEHAEAIQEMRDILRERGTVSNRDFSMSSRKRTSSYRGRKDSALALYTMWRTGEVMTHHRENFERVYALTETVAPAHLMVESSETEAAHHLIRKEVAFAGLSRINRTPASFHNGVPFSQADAVLNSMLADGELIEVQVEGWKQSRYLLGSDLPDLLEVAAGRLPAAWAALGPTTQDEVVILAPLDPVSARGRAKVLFDFDYVWEVYKPEHKRKYGYYTLPILWGERLAARFDSRLDRANSTLIILGFWLEDDSLAANGAFTDALRRGFARFNTFLSAERLDASRIEESRLRKHLEM